jgi:hypothetical protein
MHVHCFTGDWGECQRWLTEYTGCYIGLTPLVGNPVAKQVHEVATNIPLDRLLLETDAPYFLPIKVRTLLHTLTIRHCHSPCSLTQLKHGDYLSDHSLPGHVIHVAAQIATLRDIPLSKVLEVTTRNAKEMYRLDFEREAEMEVVSALASGTPDSFTSTSYTVAMASDSLGMTSNTVAITSDSVAMTSASSVAPAVSTAVAATGDDSDRSEENEEDQGKRYWNNYLKVVEYSSSSTEDN